MIEWGKITKEESLKIAKIAERASKKFGVDFLDTMMDIEATHTCGCRLNLEKLLTFDDFNFAHDISGIRNCLDRSTGKLTKCFLPRCAM